MAAAAQAPIDEEIMKQILSLCNLRTRRNTFSLISCLPTETLSAVFIQCARDNYCERGGRRTRTAPSWVNVSYVCAHWRTTAMECPTLWSYLFITSPRWTTELLARSKTVPLKLRVMLDYEDRGRRRLDLLEQVLNHVERLQELHIDLPSSDFEGLIFPELSSRASRLQNLKIKAGNYSPDRSWKLFDGDAPMLDTLELSECSVLWHSFKLKGLTTLILRDVPSRLQQNMMDFLAMLSPLQDLTHLYIHRSLASAARFLSSTEFHTFQKISLPHLSRLLIAAPLSTVIALLACVDVPPETEVGLDCYPEDDFTLSYYPVFSFLAQRMWPTLTFRSLVINSPMFDPRLTFSTLERDCDDFYPRSHRDWDRGTSLKIRICLKSSTTDGHGDRILSDISSFVPLTNVQSVHVICPPFSPGFWRHMSGHLPDLRYIRLSSGISMPNLESVLSVTEPTAREGAESQGGHADQNLNQMLAPALEELVIHNITFPGRPKLPCYADRMDLQSLFDALATRKAPGGRLTMTRCMESGQRFPVLFDLNGLWKDGCFREVGKRKAGFISTSDLM